VTREYPSRDIYDSVTEARVNALAGFGFTQRQREFLVTVMVHSGCFLERQYCAFTGTVRGQNSRPVSWPEDSSGPSRQEPLGEGDCTTSSTSRSTKPLARLTTGTGGCERSAAWSNA